MFLLKENRINAHDINRKTKSPEEILRAQRSLWSNQTMAFICHLRSLPFRTTHLPCVREPSSHTMKSILVSINSHHHHHRHNNGIMVIVRVIMYLPHWIICERLLIIWMLLNKLSDSTGCSNEERFYLV